MLRENIKNELISYISRLDEGEQTDLLAAIKNRELLKQAMELDTKQRSFKKGRKLPTMYEIVKTVREVRAKNAKKAA